MHSRSAKPSARPSATIFAAPIARPAAKARRSSAHVDALLLGSADEDRVGAEPRRHRQRDVAAPAAMRAGRRLSPSTPVPANMLLDAFVCERTEARESYDRRRRARGARAASTSALLDSDARRRILRRAAAENDRTRALRRALPRAPRRDALVPLSIEDGAATLTELTAAIGRGGDRAPASRGARVIVERRRRAQSNAARAAARAAAAARASKRPTRWECPPMPKRRSRLPCSDTRRCAGARRKRAAATGARRRGRARRDRACERSRVSACAKSRRNARSGGVSAESAADRGDRTRARPASIALATRDARRTARRRSAYAVEAVLAQADAIARAVDAIVARLARGGRLHYVGAGSSGRIATLDAAEMPPTFGTPPELVRAHVAGGARALVAPVEGAEDDASAGARRDASAVAPRDAVVGISASGGAAFVVAALERARAIGALDDRADERRRFAARATPPRSRDRARDGCRGAGRLDAAEGRNRAEDRAQRDLDRGDGALGQGLRQPDGRPRRSECKTARARAAARLRTRRRRRSARARAARARGRPRQSCGRDGAARRRSREEPRANLLERSGGSLRRAALIPSLALLASGDRVRSDRRSAGNVAASGDARADRRRAGRGSAARRCRDGSSRRADPTPLVAWLNHEAARAATQRVRRLDRHARVRRLDRVARSRARPMPMRTSACASSRICARSAPPAWIGAFGTIMRLAPTGIPAGTPFFAPYPVWSYIAGVREPARSAAAERGRARAASARAHRRADARRVPGDARAQSRRRPAASEDDGERNDRPARARPGRRRAGRPARSRRRASAIRAGRAEDAHGPRLDRAGRRRAGHRRSSRTRSRAPRVGRRGSPCVTRRPTARRIRIRSSTRRSRRRSTR